MTDDKQFKKRTFNGLGEVIRDAVSLAARPKNLLGLVGNNGEVSPAFREKIMLAVTSVNECRYCSFVHSNLAKKEGLSAEEISSLISGYVSDADEEEQEALLYAQHWAETRGEPDYDARQKVLDIYGEKRTEAIETTIRSIMFGNYFGNTVDSLLFKVSRGRIGG